MSKTNQFEYDLLRLIFNAVDTGNSISNLASTAGTTDVWVGLHTADPTEAGSSANEGGYAAYTRIAVDRSSGAAGWAVTSNATTAPAGASPVTALSFPQVATTSTGTFTHASVNVSSNSTGPEAYYYGTITPNINFSQNVTPQITTGSSITEQ